MNTRLLAALLACTGVAAVRAQSLPANAYAGLEWRCIGPFRGGRTVGATGVPGHPSTFLVGVNNGGVWKTDDYGLTWNPIFDDQPTGSIGTVAVAPSDANRIYVGSGEGLQRPDLSVGDGVYRSDDGGETWKHMGLRDGLQIPAIVVNPKDKDELFVGVLGHPYGPNTERGVFRSTNGGQSWSKVLYIDENTGAATLAMHPTNPKIVYADLWSARQGPWENGAWQGPGSGLYVTADSGAHWRKLTKGLPTFAEGLGRIGVAIAPSKPSRMYAMVDAARLGGVYRSDDAGESWRRVSDQQRLWGRGDDFAEVKVDPKNPDRIYVANTSLYRSEDAGETWTCIKGSPGGDDYHTVWIDPDRPEVILTAADQGAAISVNDGRTWSSWYNQPTAQFYHVATDNAFPYRVYGGQQESGSAGVLSRGPDGQITFRDWHPVGADEYAYVAPDPLDPNLIYGGKVTRYDHRTGRAENVGPNWRGEGHRALRTMPLLFSPVDRKTLYFATEVLYKTDDAAKTWQVISPDLSRPQPAVPASVGVFATQDLATMRRRGVIYAVAPSNKTVDTIWAGTDDGLIHLTRDGGKSWKDVTPPELTPWSKVSQLDAGHFDDDTVYAAINRIRVDDLKPWIYRTHDGGKTWKRITSGLPDNEPVNTVREDPVARGLLYCGTERAVYFSLDDGDHWNLLRQNMPATSIRDLVVKDADLVVGTHGRSFWILDDVSPLRQMAVSTPPVTNQDLYLFAPQPSYRLVWNQNTDTPLPPEEPAGKNPPDGAILYYWLRGPVASPVTIEIVDGDGKVVRRYSSDDKPVPIDPDAITVMTLWARPPERVSAEPGLHRLVWDQYSQPPGGGPRLPMTAVKGDTPVGPRGEWMPAGTYSVRLKAGGATREQKLELKPDPR
ncbi:MAG: glycoside hydrolase [Chthonomonadaceae bacterium]|nr:glycoside hydrolase [Chthonomonadaceae bacterium]